ncbi:MAG: DUF2723 domain-containing protein [Planctomycetota bacterium]
MNDEIEPQALEVVGSVPDEVPVALPFESLPKPSLPRDWLLPLAFVVPFAVYFFTLAPTVTLEDSGEFISVAYHLGVAHPPGYPLWCLLAHAFTYLPFGNVAERVHLLSAVSAAGTTGFVYLCGRKLTGNRPASLLAAWSLGVSRIFWSQSVIAEVYTLNTLLLAMELHGVLAFREDRRRRWLYWIALVQGLGIANHNLSLLFAPVFAFWLFRIAGMRLLSPTISLPGLVLLSLGPALYLYIPWRAAQDPPVNWGNPRSASELLDHFTRKAYQSGGEEVRASGGKLDVLGHTLDALAGAGRGFNWLFTGIALWEHALFRRDKGFLFASLAIIFLKHDRSERGSWPRRTGHQRLRASRLLSPRSPSLRLVARGRLFPVRQFARGPWTNQHGTDESFPDRIRGDLWDLELSLRDLRARRARRRNFAWTSWTPCHREVHTAHQ